MRDLIAIAKSRRSRLHNLLNKYDSFIALAEELASRTEDAGAAPPRERIRGFPSGPSQGHGGASGTAPSRV